MNDKVKCQYCDKEYSPSFIARHEAKCELNPDNEVTGTVEEVKVEVVASEAEMTRDYKSTRQQLNAMPKHPIFIVPTQTDKKGSKKEICLNGVTYSIPIGVRFKAEEGVPKPILDIYEDSYERTEIANEKIETELKKEIITIQS